MIVPAEAKLAIEAGGRWPGAPDATARRSTIDATADPPMRFAARLYRDIASVAAVWTRLEAEGHATAYQRLDWLTCVCDHLAAPARATPLFVELRNEATDETVLLLPLASLRRFGVTVVGWLDFGVSDYAAPLVAPGVDLSAEEAERAWAAVLSVLPGADLIDLRQVPSGYAGIVNPLAQLRACRSGGLQTFGIGLEGDPKTLMRRIMGPRAFRDLARRQSRLGERGPVRLVEATREPELAALFAVMIEQRRRRFQRLGRFDLLSRPEVAAFYRDAALRSLRAGGPVRLFGLSVGGQWVATAYMLVHAGTVHGIILSIAGDEWNSCAPGLIMAARIMQWSLASGHGYFDMTVGSLPFKGDLGARADPLYRILEARSARGSLALRAVTTRARLSAWLERHPDLSGTMRTIRRRLRRLGAMARQ